MHRNRRLLVGLGVILAVCVVVYLFFWSGLFRFQPEEGETFWHLMHQKGHWYLEVFISGVETILFDIVIGLVGWRFLLKPYIAERQAQAIAEEHALHGIEDHDHEVHESVAHALNDKESPT
jgi:flagellar biosynthesis/type III secretory pathway M-ring protein FliF/YscJ